MKKKPFDIMKNTRTLLLKKDGTLYAQLKWNKNADGDLGQFFGKNIVIPTGPEENRSFIYGFVSCVRPCGIILTNWRIEK